MKLVSMYTKVQFSPYPQRRCTWSEHSPIIGQYDKAACFGSHQCPQRQYTCSLCVRVSPSLTGLSFLVWTRVHACSRSGCSCVCPKATCGQFAILCTSCSGSVLHIKYTVIYGLDHLQGSREHLLLLYSPSLGLRGPSLCFHRPC